MEIKLDMVGIVSANMAESVRFYRLLEIEVADSNPGEPYLDTTLPNGMRLSWNDLGMVKELNSHWVDPVGQRLELAFLCDGPAGVDAAYQKIVDAGFQGLREPWDAFWGQRYAQVLDPDGNEISLFAPLGS